MPIYTYRCENCGVRFERYQKFEDQTLTWCPECNKKTLLKVFQPVGIVFKGSGFYSTDNRSPSGQTWGSQNSEKSSETKLETKTEAAKPAEASTTTPAAPKTENKSES